MTATRRATPPVDHPRAPAPPPPPSWRRFLIPLGLALTLLLLLLPALTAPVAVQQVGYGELFRQIEHHEVETLVLSADGGITGVYRPDFHGGALFASQYPTGVQGADQAFLAAVRNPSLVPHFVATGSSAGWLSTLLSFLPLIVFVAYFLYLGARARPGSPFRRGAAFLTEARRPTTTFQDVAGYEGVKRDVAEVVDFLRNPGRYAAAGAVGPRGVLMAGPPGTGKTLIARAVAGEAGVPFFSATGSSFVEMFVGVGASRVRDLFQQARKRAPSIVFLDEIDAIGARRGVGPVGNDEREQTLNQLLAEMDGFDPSTGVVVLAATNRPEVLDPALLRPGRFDRQVTVPLPTQRERQAILEVHARGKHLAADVDLAVTARATAGFSGADLANLVNEAAILAVRADRTEITAADLADARDRVLLGARQPSGFLLEDEKRNVAVHEAGHALTAALQAQADPVEKVTILPSGMALGVTEQLPEEERHLYTEDRLRATLAVRLGGRAAELVVFGQASSGAANDLASATELATRMVREFGLSPTVGPVGYGSGSPRYLGAEELTPRPYSEATQRVVDTEVARLLQEAEATAVDLLRTHRTALDELTALLIAQETVDGETVRRIAERSRRAEPSVAGR